MGSVRKKSKEFKWFPPPLRYYVNDGTLFSIPNNYHVKDIEIGLNAPPQVSASQVEMWKSEVVLNRWLKTFLLGICNSDNSEYMVHDKSGTLWRNCYFQFEAIDESSRNWGQVDSTSGWRSICLLENKIGRTAFLVWDDFHYCWIALLGPLQPGVGDVHFS